MPPVKITSLCISIAAIVGVAAILRAVAAAEPAAQTVKSITLPTVASELPDAPGRKVVIDRCVTCHTPRYITSQPPFSRDTWLAEVQKMRKNYGAPVGDDQVDEIVNYLVTIRGKD
jgi:mono/diheme cytochrome c family protein